MRLPSDTLARPHCGIGKIGGFTLVELLVVLAILALMMALVPQLTAGLPRLRLHMAAADLADVLRQLRDDAIRTGRPAAFVLDGSRLRYTLTTSPGWQPFPASVQEVSFMRDSPARSIAEDAVRFYADGSASGGVITLKNGSQTTSVAIDWLSGRVRTGD